MSASRSIANYNGLDIHPCNITTFDKIIRLRDVRGRHVLKPPHMQILGIVGQFQKGNWMREEKIVEQTFIGQRTLRRHVEYLREIKVIEVNFDDDGKKLMRLREPELVVVPSLCEYRKAKGMSEYRYGLNPRKDKDMEDDAPQDRTPATVESLLSFFAGDDGKFCPETGQNLPGDRAKFASYKETTNLDKEFLTKHHPLNPPRCQKQRGGTEKTGSKGKGKNNKNNKTEEAEYSEPIKPKRQKRPKNSAERKSAAIALHNRGHVANPIGVVDMRGRRMKPALAREIGATGSVTLSQLWRALLALHTNAYGSDKEFLDNVPGTKESVQNYFSEMSQRFISTCGYNPSNREIYDYIQWFYAPCRLVKRQGEREVYHTQLLGLVHIKKFYDYNLRWRSKSEPPPSGRLAKEMEVSQAVRGAYDAFARAEGNSARVRNMVRHGVVLYAEYLKDSEGLGAGDVKKRIILEMARFIATSPSPGKASAHVALAIEQSRKKHVVGSTIWEDWEVACKDMVEMAEISAREMGEAKHDGQGDGEK